MSARESLASDGVGGDVSVFLAVSAGAGVSGGDVSLVSGRGSDGVGGSVSIAGGESNMGGGAVLCPLQAAPASLAVM